MLLCVFKLTYLSGDDEENPVGKIQDALLQEQILKPDDFEVDDSCETKKDSASTNISCASDIDGMHTVGDFKVYESPALFDENHPHYKNEIFKSSRDVYDYLSALQSSKDVAKMYFNSCSHPITMEEDAYKKSDGFPEGIKAWGGIARWLKCGWRGSAGVCWFYKTLILGYDDSIRVMF